MGAKTKTVRVIPFIQIEDEFELVPLRLTRPPSPAVVRDKVGYSIRVLTGLVVRGANRTEKYDFFCFDADGTITTAPRGYAKDFRPGRVLVEELDAAVAKYAEAVRP